MNLNIILETAISLVFVYALLSIIVSAINEVIMHIINYRGNFLHKALSEVFNDTTYKTNLMDRLYSHPGIDRLKKTPKRLPSYISSRAFASTMIDAIGSIYEAKQISFKQDPVTLAITPSNASDNETAFDKFRKGLDAMHYSDIKVLLRTLTNGANNIEAVQKNIETWYDDYMDRIGGWYKSRLQRWLFIIALVVAFVVNVDTIKLVRYISRNDIVREQMVKGAEVWAQERVKKDINNDSLAAILREISDANKELNAYNLPIGADEYASGCMLLLDPHQCLWGCCSCLPKNGKEPASIFGILVTALAISFGAPFWFETLSKLVNIRRTGKKPKTSDQATT